MKVLLNKKLLALYVILLLSFIFTGKIIISENKDTNPTNTITAIIPSNSTDYFIYKGHTMGFQYDLLKEFTKEYDYEFEVINESDLGKAFTMLENSECTVIATNLTITRERAKRFAFTIPFDKTRQVLVQRKGKKEKKLIRNLLDLSNKEIYVPKSSAFSERLANLSEETGNNIIITEINYSQERLVKDVANGVIDYTVCDENIANVLTRLNKNLDFETKISFKQNIAWALNKENKVLREQLNGWFKRFTKTKKYAFLRKKFYDSNYTMMFADRGISNMNKGQVSVYDNEIMRHSKIIDWDWRLVAALIYQESAFNLHIKSHMGAYGLMQLMPQNAKRFNITKESTPSDQIQAGVRILKQIDKLLPKSISNKDERVKFILASYNAGIGHVYDARRLAVKYGKDPNIWTGNVDYFLLKKSEKKYYKDSVVKYGYCRGKEPYFYVRNILKRYNHYKNMLAEK